VEQIISPAYTSTKGLLAKVAKKIRNSSTSKKNKELVH